MSIATAARAGRKEWIGLAVLVLPCLLITMDMSVLYFSLPFISADLAPTGTQQLWIMDIYAFALAGLLITMGSLGDRIGRRRLLLVGAAAFGVASVCAAYSNSAEMLIATRALLGVAGATLMPSTLALIRNMFHDPNQRKTAIAIWTSGMVGGATLGPIVGGLLMDYFWWGSAFMINVPAMLLLLALGPVLLPEFRNPDAGRFDLVSAVLSLGAVLPVIHGIKKLAIEDFHWASVAGIAAGLALGVVFIRRQRTLADPMIDTALFRRRAFSASIAINVITMFTFVGVTLFTTQYLQLVLGMRPFKAALWSLAATPVIMVAVTVATILAKKFRPAYIVGSGLLVATGGLVVLTQLRTDSSLLLILTACALLAAGVLMAATITGDMILTAAPPERAGTASALAETASELGGALGVAILGSIGVAVYRREVEVPAEVTGPALDAARETLGAAVAVAQQLPGELGSTLVAAGRQAFTHGMTVTAVVAAGVMVVAAVGAFVLLRRVPVTVAEATPEPAPEPAPEPRALVTSRG